MTQITPSSGYGPTSAEDQLSGLLTPQDQVEYLRCHQGGTSDEVDRKNNQETEGGSEVNLVNNQNVPQDLVTPPRQKGTLISDPVNKSLPEKVLNEASSEDPHVSNTNDASASDSQSGLSQNDISYESDKSQGLTESSDVLSPPVSSQNDALSVDAPDNTTYERGEDEGQDDDAITPPVSDQNETTSKDASNNTTHKSSKDEGPADDVLTPPVSDRYDTQSVDAPNVIAHEGGKQNLSSDGVVSPPMSSPEHKFSYSIEETSYDKTRSSPVIDPVLLTKFDRNSELVCPPVLANRPSFQL